MIAILVFPGNYCFSFLTLYFCYSCPLLFLTLFWVMSVFVPFWFLFIFKLGPFFIEQLLLKVHVREGPDHYFIVADVFCMPQDCCVVNSFSIFPQTPSGLSTAGLIIRQRGMFTAASPTADFLYFLVPCGPALLLLLLRVTWGVDRLPPPNLLPFSWCHHQGIICFKITFFFFFEG